MKQWRVLCPESKLSLECEKRMAALGYTHTLVKEGEETSALAPIIHFKPPQISPFTEAFHAFLKKIPKKGAVLWESALFQMDLKQELLKRALLPSECFLYEIDLIEKALAGGTLFYLLPFEKLPDERWLAKWSKESSAYFVFPSHQGGPKRHDLPRHAMTHPAHIPFWDSKPLGDWPQPYRPPHLSSFFLSLLKEPLEGSVLETQLKLFQNPDLFVEQCIDAKYCLIQAVAEGREKVLQEEFRLLTEVLIAEMRWEEKRGVVTGHEQKKQLIIKGLEALRLPIPYLLKAPV